MQAAGDCIVSTRREFLSFIPAVWLPVIDIKAERDARIAKLLGDLALALEVRHGGKWKTALDDKNRYVLLCRH